MPIRYTPTPEEIARAEAFATACRRKFTKKDDDHAWRDKQGALGKLGEIFVADYLGGSIDWEIYEGYTTEPDVDLGDAGGIHVKTCELGQASWLVDQITVTSRPDTELMAFVSHYRGELTLEALLTVGEVRSLLKPPRQAHLAKKTGNPKLALYLSDIPASGRLH